MTFNSISSFLYIYLQYFPIQVTELTLIMRKYRIHASELQHAIRCLRYNHVQLCHLQGDPEIDDNTPPSSPYCPDPEHTFTSNYDVMRFVEGEKVFVAILVGKNVKVEGWELKVVPSEGSYLALHCFLLSLLGWIAHYQNYRDGMIVDTMTG